MKFLKPKVTNYVKLVMVDKVSKQNRIAWFPTVRNAQEMIMRSEEAGALGVDYWIQNVRNGEQYISDWEEHTKVPGAVYLQQAIHPTLTSTMVRFYICVNKLGVPMVEHKVLSIDYVVPHAPNMYRILINTINPENDVVVGNDVMTYIPACVQNYPNQEMMEGAILRHFITNMIGLVLGPVEMDRVLKEESNIEEVEEHHHEHHHHDHTPEQTPETKEEVKEEPAKKFTIGIKTETERKAVSNPVETKKEVANTTEPEEEEDDAFDYDPDDIESNQDVVLLPENKVY